MTEEILSGVTGLWRVLVPIAAIILSGWALIAVSRHLIHRAERRRGGLHLSFFQHLISGVIVILCAILILSVFGGVKSVMTTLLSGTAVLTAVLAFVAQDVIKDLLAGLMINIHKPFTVGDRIVLEDGTAGVVLDITMRHVVLAGVDSQRVYIPNSKISAMRLTNFITPEGNRSVYFKFSVGYESDLELAKRLIADAVEKCEYTVPGWIDPDGKAEYGPVRFLAFEESALILAVTAYYPRTVSSSQVIDDVNMRVRTALRENGIEIPYNYLTVVQQNQ